MLSEELYNLRDFFYDNPIAGLCFTGGVNSTYLLYAGKQCGAKLKAYYVKTAFQPEFELENALRLAKQFHVHLSVLKVDILSDASVAENSSNRCYYCKRKLLSVVKNQAEKDGFNILIEGSITSTRTEACLGSLTLSELSVRSPLMEFGITKTKIRMLSKKAGLLTWDKPAYSCLATQIPTGCPMTAEDLGRIERAEKELFMIGFTNFRVRLLGNTAKLQFPASQMETALEKRNNIIERLKPDFDSILLDLEGH